MLTTNIIGLQTFYEQMIRKMQIKESEKTDSWVGCNTKYLEFALHEEIREYDESGSEDELIDIANMCMMLYNRKKEKNIP